MAKKGQDVITVEDEVLFLEIKLELAKQNKPRDEEGINTFAKELISLGFKAYQEKGEEAKDESPETVAEQAPETVQEETEEEVEL